MNKEQVKKLIDGDDMLRWWAAVLFSEICELVEHNTVFNGYSKEEGFKLIVRKLEEWDRIVHMRMTEIAEGNIKKLPSLEQRVAALEKLNKRKESE